MKSVVEGDGRSDPEDLHGLASDLKALRKSFVDAAFASLGCLVKD